MSLVVGNWKMNPATVADAVALANEVRATAKGAAQVGVAPAAIALAAVARELAGSAVAVYAQDVHWEEKGAYTGQTSTSMIKGLAVGSIVGHSEMRRDQGDDDARVARKVTRALSDGLRVILCVGESEAEYVAGSSAAVVHRQIVAGLGSAPREALARLVIAYEPIWAIGTGRAATAAHATLQAASIRAGLSTLGIDAAATAILYGGSVTPANAAEFAAAEGIGGALVGGASLKATDFAGIVAAFS